MSRNCFDFCIPLGDGHHLHISRMAEDYLDAENMVRRELARPVLCGDDDHLVLTGDMHTHVSPATLVWRTHTGPTDAEGRALGGPWWTIKEQEQSAQRIVNGSLLRLSWRDTHKAIEWLVQLDDRIIGERREGDFFQSWEFYPFAWADAAHAGFRIERVDGVLTAIRADGTRWPLQ